MRVFLVGYMGSGKTSLGKKLAYNLKHEFIDLDASIEEQEGRSISQIFETDGEEYFRKIERLYLHRILNMEGVVISTGGGTPCHFDNMEQMNEYGTTIYINTDPKVLINRLKTAKDFRPLIAGKTEDELTDFVFQSLRDRTPFYTKANHIVAGFDLTAQKLEALCHKN